MAEMYRSYRMTNTLGRKSCRRRRDARRRTSAHLENTPPRSILSQRIQIHNQTHKEVSRVPDLRLLPKMNPHDLDQHHQSLPFSLQGYRNRGTIPSCPRRAHILTIRRRLLHQMDRSRAIGHSYGHPNMIWHPKVLISDNNTQFKGSPFKEWYEEKRIH